MLTLLLLRHAKSDWSADLGDHERPLNKRGEKAAPLLGRYIKNQDLSPNRIICSDAVRARATLSLVLPELPPPPPDVRIEERLYLASADIVLDEIRKHAGENEPRMMVVGHNPGMHALALALVGSGDKKARGAMAKKFPTAALAVMTFDTDDWQQVGPASGKLETFVVPRELG